MESDLTTALQIALGLNSYSLLCVRVAIQVTPPTNALMLAAFAKEPQQLEL